MNISGLAFTYKPIVFAVTAVIMVIGFKNYFTLPSQEDPTVTVREAVITTVAPGFSPQRVELLVTKTLEEHIRQISELEEIRSTSRAGVSVIHAEVHDRYFQLEQIWDELRVKVNAAAADLPEGVAKPVVNDDFGDVAVITAALTGDGYSYGEMFDIAKHVRDNLYAVPGTKRIDLLGVQEERVFIETLNTRLAEYGIDQSYLTEVLRNQNMIRPGGVIDTGERNFIVQPSGNYESLEAIKETLIALPGDTGRVPLRDIATVRRSTIDPAQRKAYYNGEPAIVFAITMLDGFRVLDYAPQVRHKLANIEQTLPVGYEINIVTYQAEQVANAVFGVTASVLQTLLIVLTVVVLFLGLRTGLIVGSIVPAVMLLTLAFMGFTGVTLERMSLATLILALGLLVDNGIVIGEEFKRRLDEGETRKQALVSVGRYLSLPLLSSTLTTILMFMPLMLAVHRAGEYTRTISLVILITLMISWFVAMMITPVLCYYFMKRERIDDRHNEGMRSLTVFGRLEYGYEIGLRKALRHRLGFILLMAISFVVGVVGVSQAPKKFFPASDRAQVTMTLDLPADVSMSTTEGVLARVFDKLNDRETFPYLLDYAGYAGFGGPRFILSLSPLDASINKAFIVANLDSIDSMPRALAELRAMFIESFPPLNARVTDMFMGPSDPGVFQYQVKGPDADVISNKALEMERALRDIPGMIDVYNDWEGRVPKLMVDINQARARRAGVTSRAIANTLTSYFSGREVSEFREGDDAFPIYIRGDRSERVNIEQLQSLAVPVTGGGDTVPIMQVARVSLESDYAAIQRENLIRTVTVEGRPTASTPEDILPAIAQKIEALSKDLPLNHSIEYDGIIAESKQGKAALAANVPLCFGLVVLLLVAQFNSFKRPLIILLTIPLILGGAALGLHIMNAEFGFIVILGLLALAGIVINNAIVLIDRIDLEREAAVGDGTEAIIRASKRRLRPIVMTTVTTILGLLPLIVSEDRLFYGMACVIAFGLAVATVLTLGFTPVLYSLLIKEEPRLSSGPMSDLRP